MIQREAFLRRSGVPVITIVSICALVLGIGAVARKSAREPRTQGKTPQIQNKTRSFEVVRTPEIMQTRINDDGLELSLRNGSDKNITAFAVSVNRTISETDFVFSEFEDQRGIVPQTVYTKRFSFALSGNPDDTAQQNLDISVLAVVFDDKSSEGDPRLIAAILGRRQESKVQLTRIVHLLDKPLDSPGIIDDTVLGRLKSRISALPTDSQSSSEKEDTLRRLDQVDRSSLLERIRRLKETYENLIARL